MNKITEFLDFFNYLVKNCKEPVTLSDDVNEVLEMLKAQETSLDNKPIFTESGFQILEYLQSIDSKNLKAKDIADGMGISSRKVSGAMRKLVSDGFVDKFGQNPVIYSLTEKGKSFDIMNYKEKMNNEEDND